MKIAHAIRVRQATLVRELMSIYPIEEVVRGEFREFTIRGLWITYGDSLSTFSFELTK